MIIPEYSYTSVNLIVKCRKVVEYRHLIPWQVKYWEIRLLLKNARQGTGFRLLGLNPSFITWQLIFIFVLVSSSARQIIVYTLHDCWENKMR